MAQSEVSFAQSDFAITANVNVYDVKIIQKDDNVLTIGFDLNNAGEVQSGIKYGVILLNKDTQVIWDESVYPEKITLKKGETKKKEIVYEAPNFFKGNFSLMVVSKNENGFPFGQGVIENIELNGTGNYLELDSTKCFLKVGGEDDNKKYNLRQGVDISNEELISLFCQLEQKNTFSYGGDVHFKATTYRRTLFGEVVQKDEGVVNRNNGTLSLALPKTKKPQAYDVLITFYDNEGNVLSNNINAHYVLRGASATIQNAFLDKDHYNMGDSPKVIMRWTGSADVFPDSRSGSQSSENEFYLTGIGNEASSNLTNEIDESVKLVVSTYNSNREIKEVVFEKVLKNSQQGGQEEIDLNAFNDDKITKIDLALIDEKNSILDEMSIPILIISSNEDGMVFQSGERWTILIVLVVLIFSFVFLIVNIGKNFKGFKIIFFIVSFVTVSFFGISNEVLGASFSNSKMSGHYNTNGTVNLNKSVYYPGEDIIGTLYVTYAGCTNGANVRLRWNSINYANGATTPVTDTFTGNYGYFYHKAPLTPGTYRINFGACIAITYCNYPSTFVRSEIPVDLWYTVANPAPINATCGTRNAFYLATDMTWPTGSTLCATGFANPISVNFPLTDSSTTWTCNGSNGGANTTCTATRASALINGSCGNASGNYTAAENTWRTPACSTGTPDTDITTTPFLGSGETKKWNCIGAGAGHNDASCSATRAIITYPCIGTKPSNANVCDSTLPTESNVNWEEVQSSAYCGTRKCQYYIKKNVAAPAEDDTSPSALIESRP